MVDLSFSQFPRVFGIVYALKSDRFGDKYVSLYAQQGNELKALQIALQTAGRWQRFLAVFLYLCYQYLHRVPPLKVVLWLCYLASPNRKWFEYLLKSNTRDSLLTAKNLLETEWSVRKITLDLGTGVGYLPQQFPKKRGHFWICIDKNFFSLFLARLYHARSDIRYLCGNFEVERLFPAGSFDAVVTVDTLANIFEKKVFTEQVAQVLKKNGKFLMVNIHEDHPKSKFWGYGIDRKNFQNILKRYFKKIYWHDHRFPGRSLREHYQQLDKLGYSFVAQK